MQHQEGTRLPEQLFNGGANDTQDNVARGLESIGVPPSIARPIGHGYVIVFIVVAFLLLVRFFRKVGPFARPPKKKKKKR
jgi:hypothetical protein